MISADNDANKTSVLIIDDEQNMRHMLAKMLTMEGYQVKTAADGQQGLDELGQEDFDFVLCDIKMPNMDGMEFLVAFGGKNHHATIIMMSAYGTIDLAVKAMQLGAYDFISKPFKSDEVRLAIKKAQERDHLKKENVELKKQIDRIKTDHRFGKLVAKSDIMQSVFAMASKVAQYNTTVLITGESGTGKELVARAIHYEGPRRDHPLVPVNCGSIPENLLESELFGYIKGAFTGADDNRKGMFREADKGTIFLDEIAELSLPLQVKLLRVLQEGEIKPVGAVQSQKIDVRVIAATSGNLGRMVEDNEFRQDLFYRLNVLPIEIPPLRNRSEDIPLLCRHFLEKFNKTLGRKITGIDPDAMAYLLGHHWPGNVRELENTIERAIVLTDSEILPVEGFSFSYAGKGPISKTDQNYDGYSIKNAQKSMEKSLIIKALKATKGNRTQAAKLLEISHPSLLSKMKTYQVDL